MEQAYTARTLGELVGLTNDLAVPGGQPLRLDNSRAVTAFFETGGAAAGGSSLTGSR